jgi:formylglycine-generating enzyme required for sulfatase activity
MLSVAVIIGFASCSKKSSSKSASRATGWNVDVVKASGKKTSSWTWIDFCGGGTFTMGKVQDDVMHDGTILRHSNMFNFYMDETEVTNFMYLEYLIG